MDQETAKYIVNYFAQFLTEKEKLAIRHTRSTIKLESANNELNTLSLTNVYKKRGWLTGDNEVIDLLKNGYDNFEISAARRILLEHKRNVFLNYCPKCNHLARTPRAKQCKKCEYEWH